MNAGKKEPYSLAGGKLSTESETRRLQTEPSREMEEGDQVDLNTDSRAKSTGSLGGDIESARSRVRAADRAEKQKILEQRYQRKKGRSVDKSFSSGDESGLEDAQAQSASAKEAVDEAAEVLADAPTRPELERMKEQQYRQQEVVEDRIRQREKMRERMAADRSRDYDSSSSRRSRSRAEIEGEMEELVRDRRSRHHHRHHSREGHAKRGKRESRADRIHADREKANSRHQALRNRFEKHRDLFTDEEILAIEEEFQEVYDMEEEVRLSRNRIDSEYDKVREIHDREARLARLEELRNMRLASKQQDIQQREEARNKFQDIRERLESKLRAEL